MVKPRPALSILASAVAATLATVPVHAEVRFTPDVTWNETWSDNAGLQPPGQERSQLISSLSPGFTLVDDTPRVKLRATYRLNLYAYSGAGGPTGTNSRSQSLSAEAKSRLIGDELFMDASANISQVPTSAFGPGVLPGNDYTSTNRNEIRTYSLTPYLMHNFGTLANLMLRYQFDKVESDNRNFGRSTGNTLTGKLSSGASFRKVGWTLSASQQILDDTVAAKSHISNANLGLDYMLAEQLSLTASGGYDRYDYDSPGSATKGASGTIGFQWAPSARTSITANGGHRFYGPTYYLAASHRSRNTVWSINYNDTVSNSRNQFTLPSTVSTASLLDQLFAAAIPDPVQRAAAVRAYIASTGLPASLPNAVNYFSNRFFLQRQFLASSFVKLSRSSAMFNVYKSRSEAVSTNTVDSSLFGNQNSLLNESTVQEGISASLQYQLGPRTQATMTASANKVESLATGRVDHNRRLSVLMSRQFASKLSGVAELRRTHGSLAAGSQKYTENAISAGLSMQF